VAITLVSPHITLSEYWCQHCHKLPPLLQGPNGSVVDAIPEPYAELFRLFENIRMVWGRSIPVSGYRCSDHELEVSGSRLSPHIFGLALDLGIIVADQPEFIDIVKRVAPELRYGTNIHPSAVHVHIDNAYRIIPIYSNFLMPGVSWVE
jgi:hypothetical protein